MEKAPYGASRSKPRPLTGRQRAAIVLGWLAFACWVLITVDGLLPQVQMVLLGGSVAVPNVTLKFLFLAVLCGAAICGRRLSVPWQLRGAYVLFLVYLAFDALLIFLLWPPNSLEYVLFGYDAYFFWLLIIALLPLTALSIRERPVVRTLLLVFIPLAALGIAQHALRLPILPTASNSGPYAYVAMSVGFFGQVRAFSLFSSPLIFGTFVAVLACIALSQLLFTVGRMRLFWTVAFGATLLAIYCTLTRVVYLEALFGCVSVVLIRRALMRKGTRSKVKLLPLKYGLAAVGLAFWLGPLVGSFSRSITSDVTLIGRLGLWSKYFSIWTSGGLLRFLFGTGLIQNNRFSFSSSVLIDSSYLAVATQVGFVGLVLWFYLMWRVWRYMLDETLRLPSPMRIGLASFFSAWIAAGTFNVLVGPFTAVLWLYVAAMPRVPEKLGLLGSACRVLRPKVPVGRMPGRQGGLAGMENPV